MGKLEFITMEQAEAMSKRKLQTEIGKRVKYLKEQLGMGAEDAADFTASLLNLGVAMNDRLNDTKLKNNN